MNKEKLEAIFLLAGIEIEAAHELANNYWPDCDEYSDLRRKSPWWLVQTKFGLIKIGWRKRVISIDWSDTKYRAGVSTFADGRPISKVTNEDVTQTETLVHAWSYGKAIDYLQTLELRFQQVAAAEEEAA